MSFLKKLFGREPKDPNAGSLDAHMDYLNTLTRPAVHLRKTDAPGFNKLGGVPDLPAGFEWPAWEGKPMMFLCQVDLGEVAALLPEIEMPHGKLYFFYDQTMNATGNSAKERGAWCVRLVPSDTPTRPCPPPDGRRQKNKIGEKYVTLARIETYPDAENEKLSSLSLSDEQWDTYCDIRYAIFGDDAGHHLFGYTQPIQGDRIEVECQLAIDGSEWPKREEWDAKVREAQSEWLLLLQLDMDNDIDYMWGDAGSQHFCIRKDDLRAGRFENVWMIAECH